ncbi:hypothetical protein [Streptomyces sp. NPDC054838]
MAGALLLALCCASLINAASDSDELLDSAKRAQCAAHINAGVAPLTGVDRRALSPRF